MWKNRKPNAKILDKLNECLLSGSLKETFRVGPQDFTRRRKMPFEKVVLFTMNLSRRSLQIDLTRFIRSFADGIREVTGSAFNQNRKKLRPEVFRKLLEVTTQEFYSDNEERVKQWRGMRLLATDASVFRLPTDPGLKAIYGGATTHTPTDIVNARGSVLYDVLNNLVLHGVLAPYTTSERDLARQHLGHCGRKDLVIYDRGYPSYELMNQVVSTGAHFLMRCKHSFNQHVLDLLASDQQSALVSMAAGKRTDKGGRIQVRLVKVVLDSGEIETLITSLLDEKEHPTQLFKDLYNKRWGVEQFYDVVKNIVCVENFTGHTDRVILQDFHGALLMCNIHSLLVSEAEEEIPQKTGRRKYDRKINKTVSFGFMKDAMVSLLVQPDPQIRIDGLKDLFLRNTIPIRPGRSFPRDHNKHKARTKPKYFPNSRSAW
jgi:DDE family transposase